MEKRKLATSDLLVSPLTFGVNVFGWTLDEPVSFKMLDAFAEAGFKFIDTANTYCLRLSNEQMIALEKASAY